MNSLPIFLLFSFSSIFFICFLLQLFRVIKVSRDYQDQTLGAGLVSASKDHEASEEREVTLVNRVLEGIKETRDDEASQ